MIRTWTQPEFSGVYLEILSSDQIWLDLYDPNSYSGRVWVHQIWVGLDQIRVDPNNPTFLCDTLLSVRVGETSTKVDIMLIIMLIIFVTSLVTN